MLITKKDKRNLKAAEIYKRAKEIRTRKLMLIVDKYYVLILNGFKLKFTSFHLGTCLSFAQLVGNIHINVGQGYAFLFASLCSRLYQNLEPLKLYLLLIFGQSIQGQPFHCNICGFYWLYHWHTMEYDKRCSCQVQRK